MAERVRLESIPPPPVKFSFSTPVAEQSQEKKGSGMTFSAVVSIIIVYFCFQGLTAQNETEVRRFARLFVCICGPIAIIFYEVYRRNKNPPPPE